jgi:hypothetical protein
MLAEAFVATLPVKALHERVLHSLTRLDEVQFDLVAIGPGVHVLEVSPGPLSITSAQGGSALFTSRRARGRAAGPIARYRLRWRGTPG